MAIGDLVMPDGFGLATFTWQETSKANPITTTLGLGELGGESELDDVADALFGASETANAPNTPSNMGETWTFIGVTVLAMFTGLPFGAESSQAPNTGSKALLITPTMNTSMLVRKRTSLVGKQYRGRCYWPTAYFGESAIDAMGNMIPTLRDSIQETFDEFWTNMMADSALYVPYLLHHVPKVGAAPAPTPLRSLVVQNKCATQRRRMRA